MEIETYDSLAGQVALVTGANRGIGRAIAAALRDRDAVVYAAARDVNDVSVPPDGGLRPVALDVTDDASVRRAADRIAAEAGRLDVLVNNAGVCEASRPLHALSVDDIDRTLRTNLRGPAVVTRAVLPLLCDRDGSRVVNVSSGDGAFVDPSPGYDGLAGGGYPAYRVSKTGLNALTGYLDAEYGPEIVANAVCPGAVRTDMGSPDARRSPEEGAETAVWLARFRDGPGGLFWRDREPIPW